MEQRKESLGVPASPSLSHAFGAEPVPVSGKAGITNAEHTPGPWGYNAEIGEVFYDDSDGDDVTPLIATVNVDLDTVSEAQANADGRLISAAPDLLSIVRDVFDNPGARLMIGGNPAFVEALVARAHAALTKAGAA